MRTLSKKITAFTKAYVKLESIESDIDLCRNHLTLAEFEILYSIMEKLSHLNKCDGVYCICSEVADWCKRNGLFVIPPHGDDAYGSINYYITADENVYKERCKV